MARDIPTNDGTSAGVKNRFTKDVNLQYVLMFLVGVVGPIVAIVLFAILS